MELGNKPEEVEVIEKVDDVVETEVVEEKESKTFTQSEVDAIIEKRLARAKAEKPKDYEDLLEIAMDLEEYGFVGTASEKKAALKAAKAQNKAQKELEEIEKEAEETGHSPEILKELKEAKKSLKEKEAKLKELSEKEEKKRLELQSKEEADREFDRQFNEFVESYPDIDTDSLTNDAKFIKFAKKHKGELKEIYEDYAELMEEASLSIAEKFKKSESRSTGGGKNTPSSGSVKLDSSQQKTLDEWNKRYPHMKMTPQEFIKQ